MSVVSGARVVLCAPRRNMRPPRDMSFHVAPVFRMCPLEGSRPRQALTPHHQEALMRTLFAALLAVGSLASSTNAHATEEEAKCVSGYGKVACGYHCVAGYGDVQCADTPQGACTAAYGQVRCWDPPREVFRWRRNVPQATCVSAYGKVACGYNCTSGYGDVKCASTPEAKCLAAYGKIACGYNCVSGYGDVKCASKPHGKCMAAYGQVECSG